MSKNKKIVKWEYVTKMFPVIIDPADVKRVHAPIEPSLTLFSNAPKRYLYLRPCVQGLDEDGAVVKYLYCTRDGRFFTRGKEGWNEVLSANINRSSKNPKAGGGYDAPILMHFGWKPSHRCVAFAWLDVPKDVKLQLAGENVSTKWEVDHLNTDHKNWTADNLQWVTVDENRRRAKIARRIRKAGIDPKLLTRTLLLGIYTLPEEYIDAFTSTCSEIFANDPSPLSAKAIRLDIATALDVLRSRINDDK